MGDAEKFLERMMPKKEIERVPTPEMKEVAYERLQSEVSNITSDEYRTVWYILAHKSTRKTIYEIKKDLIKLLKRKEVSEK